MGILRKPMVLVVDDDASLLSTLKSSIESLGCDVLTATNGLMALEIAQRESVSAILTDMRMPVMDGGALLDSVEALNLNIPVIVMTGYSDVSEQDIEARNAVVLLAKPFSKSKLREIIEIFVKNLPAKISA